MDVSESTVMVLLLIMTDCGGEGKAYAPRQGSFPPTDIQLDSAMKEERLSLSLGGAAESKKLLTRQQRRVLTAFIVFWSGWSDSNRRPPTPHAGALPDWATPRRPAIITLMTQARERVSEQQSVVSVQATALVLNR